MSESYLDKTGLGYFWGKIKTYVTNAIKVTGVKGNAESSYRTGNVNLTPANIGAVPTTRKVNNKALSSDITLNADDIDVTYQGDTWDVETAINDLASAQAGIRSYYQATGSSGTLSLANGKITQIPLVSTDAISGGESIFSISDGGIKVSKAGNYRITGSVYVTGVNAVNMCGCYIKKGATFASSTELFNANIGKDIAGAPQFGVSSGTKIVTLSANDIVYLCARVQGGTGTAYKDNRSTYLSITAC